MGAAAAAAALLLLQDVAVVRSDLFFHIHSQIVSCLSFYKFINGLL